MTIQQHASFGSSAAELNATSKLVKAWESKNAKNAAKAGGVSLMALSLAACGGSDSTTTAVVADPVTPVTPVAVAAVALTTSVDDITGTAGADTYTAIQTGGTDETFSAYDAIDGGAGVDTITITNTEAAVLNLANVSNVEEVIYRSTAGSATLDLANFDGATSLTMDRTVGATDVSNVGLATVLNITDGGATQNTTATYKASDVTGSADAGTVNLDGMADGSEFTLAGAIEALTWNATGDASRLDVLEAPGTVTALTIAAGADLRVDDTFTAAAITSLTVTGAGDVTLTPALASTALTVSAADATGAISFTSGGGNQTITTGSGDDVIDMAGTLTKDDTVDGGAGADTIRIDADGLSAGVTDLSVTNIETFRFDNMAGNNGAVNMDELTVTAVRLDAAQGASQAATAGILTLTDLSSSVDKFSFIGAGADGSADDNVAFNGLTADYDVSGTTNLASVELIINNAGIVADDMFVQAIDINNVEALTITATNIGQAAADELTIDGIEGNDLASITVVADGEVIISDIDSGGDNSLEVLDLSGITAGGATVSDISGNAVSLVITGSAFNDTIVTGENLGANEVTVDLGAGNDAYTSLDAVDIITTGAGSDTITLQGDANDDLNIIKDFTAGAGGDVISGLGAASDGATADAQVTLTDFVSLAAAADTLTGGINVLSGNVSALTKAGVVAAAADMNGDGTSNDALTFEDNEVGNIAYLLVDNGTDSALFLVDNSSNGTTDTAVDTDDTITLLATFEGISDVSTLTAANFSDFL